jgi:putative hemolysin
MEIGIVLALILASGLFAGAEIAVLSVRKTRLRELVDNRNRAARSVLRLRMNPERFLATVQVGITVIGATAAAFSGATMAEPLGQLLERVGFGTHADDVALGLVVALVSFLSLVLGELVPKSLALRSAEAYALALGRPLYYLSQLARPVVWLLTASSNLVLRLFGDRTTFSESRLSPDELQQLVEEAATQGTLDPRAGEIASRAIDFGRRRVSTLIVPRNEIVAIDVASTRDELLHILHTRSHTRMPVYRDDRDNVIGYATARDLHRLAQREAGPNLQSVVRAAYYVSESTLAIDVLKEMQKTRTHMALVVDELGHIVGLLTLEDLVEELVGEIFEEHETPVELVKRESDTSALVLGHAAVHEVNRQLDVSLPEGPGWSTVAGLAIARVGAIPPAGTLIALEGGLSLEVLESSGRRIQLVRVRSSRVVADEEEEEPVSEPGEAP